MTKQHLSTVFTILILLTIGPLALAQEFIVMGTPQVNIRTGPATDRVIIGQAEKGDIYRVFGKENGWYRIELFSGRERYVYAADYVYPLNRESFVPGHKMRLPDDSTCRSIYRSIEMGMQRAAQETNEIIPDSVSLEHHVALRDILQDRIMLHTLHIYGLQPAMYPALMQKGEAENW